MRPLGTTARNLTAKQMQQGVRSSDMERGGTTCAHAFYTSRDTWRMSGNLLVVIVEVDSASLDAQELQQVTAMCNL